MGVVVSFLSVPALPKIVAIISCLSCFGGASTRGCVSGKEYVLGGSTSSALAVTGTTAGGISGEAYSICGDCVDVNKVEHEEIKNANAHSSPGTKYLVITFNFVLTQQHDHPVNTATFTHYSPWKNSSQPVIFSLYDKDINLIHGHGM
jgi:hypothetical protein